MDSDFSSTTSAIEPKGPVTERRAESPTTLMSPPPWPARGLELRGAASTGRVWELEERRDAESELPKIFSTTPKNLASACGRKLMEKDSTSKIGKSFSSVRSFSKRRVRRLFLTKEASALFGFLLMG